MILDAMANAIPGDDALGYLIAQARQPNPSPFMSLIGKCIVQEQKTEGKQEVNVKVTFID
jgi:hypothetical protein